MNGKKYLLILLFGFLIGLVYSPGVVADDAPLSETATIQGANIEITYTGTWPAAAQTALEHAAAIWEPLLASIPPIEISANWDVPTTGEIAQTKLYTFIGSPNLPFPDAFYVLALGNALRGYDNCSNCVEMYLTFNNSLPNWYFGTDGNPSANQYDLVTVALRQIGIGLGFKHSFYYQAQNGTGRWGYETGGDPFVYDLFLYNGGNQQLINTDIFPSPSTALYTQMTSNDIYFNGPAAITANGGHRPKLYAPGTWGLTSFTFLDETAFPTGTTNALMTPVIQPGEVIHDPGPVALAMLVDMGWPQPITTNQTPVFTELPDLLIPMDTTVTNAIDLWDYVDDDHPLPQLGFQIISPPNPNIWIHISNNRYIDINPVSNWTGQTTVELRVTDPLQASSTGSFVVTVMDLPFRQYLPALP
jgi:hypothetical protein